MNFFMVFLFAQTELPQGLFFELADSSKIFKTTILLVINPYLNIKTTTKMPFK
jgi:hypothetical protein